jgi:methionyl-tRNA formyltransferase
MALDRALPALLAGTAPRIPMNLDAGSYFGGRTPADGRIDWSQDAVRIHNLVRAVAPPYPGATTTVGGRPARILRTRADASGTTRHAVLTLADDALVALCGGGGRLPCERSKSRDAASRREFRAHFQPVRLLWKAR